MSWKKHLLRSVRVKCLQTSRLRKHYRYAPIADFRFGPPACNCSALAAITGNAKAAKPNHAHSEVFGEACRFGYAMLTALRLAGFPFDACRPLLMTGFFASIAFSAW